MSALEASSLPYEAVNTHEPDLETLVKGKVGDLFDFFD
jgi:hypothetical protein